MIRLIKEHGQNSNSFMTLYPGFKHFTSKDPDIKGMVAFVDTRYTWIGGAEPHAKGENQARLLAEFAEAAKIAGKAVVFIPVNARTAEHSLSVGYHSILIGTEPTFDLENYPPTGNTWIDTIPTAKLLDGKGARVLEIALETLTDDLKLELDQLTKLWLNSRKMEPLGFLNQVNPWHLSEHKKYFMIQLDGKVLAFLAAIPIWARKGWYFIDLVRSPHAPAGTTELLTLQAMRLLKEQGYLCVTLGVAPLSGLENFKKISMAESTRHASIYSFLNFLYRRANFLYQFNSLYQYKIKFKPSYIEPSFLIYKGLQSSQNKLRLRDITSIFQAFMPKGIFRNIRSSIGRQIRTFPYQSFLKAGIQNSIVTRSFPLTFVSTLYRCKLTLALAISYLAFYACTLLPENWGYSWNAFLQSPFHALALSPFLHWNPLHLLLNLMSLLLFTGIFECLTGTFFVTLCYLIPMIFANPITSVLLQMAGFEIGNTLDVGASLGIFGTAGGLFTLFKHRYALTLTLALGIFIDILTTHRWIDANHWTALGLGFAVARGLLYFK